MLYIHITIMSTHTGGVRVRQVADFFWVGALGYLARAAPDAGLWFVVAPHEAALAMV